jgi:hypothetical protein
VLFSVLSYHAEGEESAYLDDDSDICAEYDLKDVEFILETKAENTAEKDGMTPYKTFYEATTSEDVWATVDKLSLLRIEISQWYSRTTLCILT